MQPPMAMAKKVPIKKIDELRDPNNPDIIFLKPELKIDDIDMEQIADELPKLKFTGLKIYGGKFRLVAIYYIVQLIKKNQSLRELHLVNCRIGIDGILEILKAVNGSSITKLDLRYNAITNNDAWKLNTCLSELQKNVILCELHLLNVNEKLDVNTKEKFFNDVFGNPKISLLTLELVSNELTDRVPLLAISLILLRNYILYQAGDSFGKQDGNSAELLGSIKNTLLDLFYQPLLPTTSLEEKIESFVPYARNMRRLGRLFFSSNTAKTTTRSNDANSGFDGGNSKSDKYAMDPRPRRGIAVQY